MGFCIFIALLYLFTGIASAFVDGGFSTALIQRQDITHTDEATVFWCNLGLGLRVSLALWGAAPWIAAQPGWSNAQSGAMLA